VSRLLLTGYPGFRASALLRVALDADPELEVVALVHPRRRADADRELATLPRAERVQLQEADPIAIDFGLSGRVYGELATSVTHVQHLYQVLDPSAAGESAERVNVGSAREIIEFARAATRLEHLVLHSSAFVSGDRRGVVLESELTAGQSFRSPVARSLALAEAMLGRHPELPFTIARAGQVVGDSQTGVVARLDGPYPLLVFLASAKADAPLPLPPRAEASLHLVPVDYVAHAAHALSRLPAAQGKTVHLVDSRPPSLQSFLERAASRFGKRIEAGFHAPSFGRALFGNPGTSLLAQNLRSLAELVTAPVSYDDATALALLRGTGITCPPFDTYADVLFSHVEARLKEKRLNEVSKEPWDVAG
jgi:nucleoside-diphosphate-sugar epimerase